MILFIAFAILIIFVSVGMKIRGRQRLKQWVTSFPPLNHIQVTAGKILTRDQAKKFSEGYTIPGIGNLPEEAKDVKGKNTVNLVYSLNVKNVTSKTLKEVIFQCAEYDKYGRKDISSFLSFPVNDLRPQETKQLIISNDEGILVLEQIDFVSLENYLIDSLYIGKRFPVR